MLSFCAPLVVVPGTGVELAGVEVVVFAGVELVVALEELLEELPQPARAAAPSASATAANIECLPAGAALKTLIVVPPVVIGVTNCRSSSRSGPVRTRTTRKP
jgi:hypothetical protein